MEIFTISFFCDEKLNDICFLKERTKQQLKQLVRNKEHIEFLICGKNKTDIVMSKIVYEIKNSINIGKIILVLTDWSEYKEAISCSYYDEIEILRNEGNNTADITEFEKYAAKRADAIVFFGNCEKRKKFILYAEKLKKKILYI